MTAALMELSSKLMLDFPIHAAVVVAALLTLLPFLFAAFWPLSVEAAQRLPIAVRIVLPAVLCVPYAMVAISYGQFRWGWFALYLLLPVVISWLLYRASVADPDTARRLARLSCSCCSGSCRGFALV